MRVVPGFANISAKCNSISTLLRRRRKIFILQPLVISEAYLKASIKDKIKSEF